MTKPRYPQTACAAGSQDRRESSPCAWSASSAWIVNFNNGNANNNNRDNSASVRAVRSFPSSECPGAGGSVPLESLHRAWLAARRAKKPSAGQASWEGFWFDRLLELQQRLQNGTWHPSPCTCFIATRPKAREIHAPAFGDRVVHHWLVPQIEPLFDRRFIHDSYSNRASRGTHAAVDRLHQFAREVDSGQGGGWFIQLDIRNFFYSVHRPTLWKLLKRTLLRERVAPAALAATHALLRHSPAYYGIRIAATAAELAAVPEHKQLRNALPGCGLPIGNLSSQFFANVYLDQLDQFVKHQLRVERYVRYVDDFVLVHRDRAVLLEWRDRIVQFLADRLRLSLKDDGKLGRLTDGVDFLGYVVRPTHRQVRRRVVTHARAALADWQARHVAGDQIEATPAQLRAVGSTWASYQGHFSKAASRRLVAAIRRRFSWLRSIEAGMPTTHHGADHVPIRISAC